VSDLAHQLKAHLQSLRSAGIEYVPIVEPLALAHLTPTESGLATRPGQPADERPKRILELATLVAQCNRCPGLFATRTQTVFGAGPLSPRVCFIGNAPSAADDLSGKPFQGPVGELFDKILTAMGLGRSEVYLLNVLKCQTPGNRHPTETECGNCREYTMAQLLLVQPEFICCLGATAARTLLNTQASMNELRASTHEFNGIPVVCTLHPAALVQDPSLKRDSWEDLKKLMFLIGHPVPEARKA
jgi:uracil-DNA glycosylase